MDFNLEDLYKKFLKLEEEFIKYIYNAFYYFKYKFILDIPFLKEEDYPIEVIKYLEKDKVLIQSIIDSIIKQKNIKIDIFNIIKYNYIQKEDIGYISVTKRYLSELFHDNITQFIFKSEKDHFLSTFIFNKLYYNKNDNIEENKNNEDNKKDNIGEINYIENQLIKEIIQYYLKKVDITLTCKFTKKIKKNTITLLFGLKLPGMKYILAQFRSYIKSEINKEYSGTNNELEFISQEEGDKIKENNYDNNLFENMERIINDNELFQILNELGKKYPMDIKKCYEWIYDDYYLLFLSDIFQNIKISFKDMENYQKILKKVIYIKNNSRDKSEEYNPVKSLTNNMVWLEFNSQFISYLLNIYKKISHEKNALDKIEKIINSFFEPNSNHKNNDIFKQLKEIPDFATKYILKSSIIFYSFFIGQEEYNHLKTNEIFNKAENDYKKLKILFENDWINRIDKTIKQQFFKIINALEENQIEKELNILKEYFKIDLKDNITIKKIKDEIIAYKKKEEINDLINDYIKSNTEKDNENSITVNKFKEDLINVKNILNNKDDNILNKIKEENQNLINQVDKLNDELKIEKEKNKNFNETEINKIFINQINKLNEENHYLQLKRNEDMESYQLLLNQVNQLNDKLNLEEKNSQNLNLKINEEKEKYQNLLNQKNKLNDELKLEKDKTKNLQLKINDLSKSLNEGKSEIKILFEKLNSKISYFNDISNNINELQMKNEININKKEIEELKKKLLGYPFELDEGEKIISIVIISKDENINTSIICKNTDNFSVVEKKFYEIHPDYKGNNIFLRNGKVINKDNNLIQNEINDNSIIYLEKNS